MTKKSLLRYKMSSDCLKNIGKNIIFMGKVMWWVWSNDSHDEFSKRKRGYQFFTAQNAGAICNESHKRSWTRFYPGIMSRCYFDEM